MTQYGIPEYPPTRYRVDTSDLKGTHWIGFDVASFAEGKKLIEMQPDSGHRYRIVAIIESVEWESP